jgi:hypothetical protein
MNNYFDLLPDELIFIIFDILKFESKKLADLNERYVNLIDIYYNNLNTGKFDPTQKLSRIYPSCYTYNIRPAKYRSIIYINEYTKSNDKCETINLLITNNDELDIINSYIKDTRDKNLKLNVRNDTGQKILDSYINNIECCYYYYNKIVNDEYDIFEFVGKNKEGEFIYIERSYNTHIYPKINVKIIYSKNWTLFWREIPDHIKRRILMKNGYDIDESTEPERKII